MFIDTLNKRRRPRAFEVVLPEAHYFDGLDDCEEPADHRTPPNFRVWSAPQTFAFPGCVRAETDVPDFAFHLTERAHRARAWIGKSGAAKAHRGSVRVEPPGISEMQTAAAVPVADLAISSRHGDAAPRVATR